VKARLGPTRTSTRILTALACLATGLLIGLAGAFVQAGRVIIGTVAIPWGTALAIGVLVIAIRGAVWGFGSRPGGWLLFGGWLLATVGLAAESPSGDLAISAGGRQWVYLLGAVILGAAAASVPPLPVMPMRARRVPRDEEPTPA
jgi:hypothetical protein